MKGRYTISVFTENKVGLLGRISAIFVRRHINVESLNVSESEYEGISRFSIDVNCSRETAERLVAQIGKIVEVLVTFLQDDDKVVSTELAMYKVRLRGSDELNEVVAIANRHRASIGQVDGSFIVLEKSGKFEEILRLYEELQVFDVIEFARTGKLVVHNGLKDLQEYLPEDFVMKKRTA